jgi:hypothetical protein
MKTDSKPGICKCGATIPAGRVALGYRVCTSCSNVERYGAVDVIFHKTGNTLQILPASTAEAIQKAGRRSGFGSMAGMRRGSTSDSLGIRGGLKKLPTPEEFQEAGERAMKAYLAEGASAAFRSLQESADQNVITLIQLRKMKETFLQLEGMQIL